MGAKDTNLWVFFHKMSQLLQAPLLLPLILMGHRLDHPEESRFSALKLTFMVIGIPTV